MTNHPERSRRIARGNSTLEILIALAILSLAFTAVLLVFAGNQSVAIDTQTSDEALGIAQAQIEAARAASRQDFNQVTSVTANVTKGPLTYTDTFAVANLTPCLARATSTVSWQQGSRTLSIVLTTLLSDVAGTMALGGDCATSAPTGGWTNPTRFASDTLSPGKPISLDVLGRIAYVGLDKDPFLAIADTSIATLGQNSGLFVTFGNGFALDKQPYSLDAARVFDSSSGTFKTYLFAAVASTTAQLRVMDVTDFNNPVNIATTSLSSCVAGSFPEGWLVYYYKGVVYLLTRETAGPEFHIFNVSTPANPVEYPIGGGSCKGLALNDTVESLVVRDQVVSGVTKRYAYFATDQNSKELRVFDVTDPLNPAEVTAANQDLPGNQDGASVFAVGSRLYFGRQSVASGADLYVFDISNPPTGIATLGSVDIGTGVIGITVAGNFGFMATPKTNQEFQVWNIANAASITNISKYNFGNIVANGVDYKPDYVYTTGQATPNLQILYSP